MRTLLVQASSLAVAALLAAGCGGDSETSEPDQPVKAEWSYEGGTGPQHWGDLDDEFGLCKSGGRQSPIDLTGARRGSFPKVATHYVPEQVEVEDNGHAIEAKIEDTESSATIDGKRYWLEQFHVHTPSEETINGRHFPAVIHMVHISEQGEIAVVAVLVRPGADNPVFAFEIPEGSGAVSDLEGKLDPLQLLPKSDLGYRYQGSLTTPPCTEGVNWTVLKQPITLSSEQLKDLREAHPDNNRPIQPRNNRPVLFGPAITD